MNSISTVRSSASRPSWPRNRRCSLTALALAVSVLTAHAEPMDHWTKAPVPPTQEYQTDVTFVNGKFWAVSWLGDVQYSTDGNTWTYPSTPTFKPLRSIAYGNGRYIVVGDSRTILSSTDGDLWTRDRQVAGNDYSRVIFANGKFVIVSFDGEVQLSPDGITWTPANMNNTTFKPWDLAWGNGLFVAVGSDSDTSSGSQLMTSPDGVTWTLRTHGLYSELFSVAYANGRFVVGGSEVLGTSPDGTTWTKVVPPANVGWLTSIEFLNGRFFASGWNGTLLSSPDGNVWTKHTTDTDVSITGVAYNGERLLMFRYGEYDPAGPWLSDPWAPVSVTPSVVARIDNLSTRGWVGVDASQLIAGFVIQGATPKQVLIRAVGPTLATYGVQGALVDPQLKLFNAASVEIGGNNDWGTNPNLGDIATASAAVFAFPLPAGSKDAVLFTTLAPGNYTMQISGVANGTGVALAEVYDLDAPGASKLVNISSRGFVGTGDNVTIPGFVISGTQSKKLLIRGIGPTLGSYGVTGVLADPKIALHDSTQVKLAENDDWTAAADQAGLAAASAQVNAFALGAGSHDAAMVVTVAPGLYTVVVSGVGNSTGVALVEVYEIP